MQVYINNSNNICNIHQPGKHYCRLACKYVIHILSLTTINISNIITPLKIYDCATNFSSSVDPYAPTTTQNLMLGRIFFQVAIKNLSH